MKHTGPHHFPWRIYFIVLFFFFWPLILAHPPCLRPHFPFYKPDFLPLFSLLLEQGDISTFKWRLNTTSNFLPAAIYMIKCLQHPLFSCYSTGGLQIFCHLHSFWRFVFSIQTIYLISHSGPSISFLPTIWFNTSHLRIGVRVSKSKTKLSLLKKNYWATT